MTTILVVDDDPQLRYITTRVLREAAYPRAVAMATAESAELVLHEMPTERWRDTILLMDVSLHPRDKYPDGCVAGRAIAREFPGVRLLFVTGLGGEDVVRRCHGNPPYLLKPVAKDALLMMVRLILRAPPWPPPVVLERRRGDR